MSARSKEANVFETYQKIAAVCGLALATAASSLQVLTPIEQRQIKTTFQIWDDAQRGGIWRLADAYMARHPEVSIEVQK